MPDDDVEARFTNLEQEVARLREQIALTSSDAATARADATAARVLAAGADVAWSPTGTVRVLRDIAGGRMDRRGFMVVTGGALSGMAASWAGALKGAPAFSAVSSIPGDVGWLTAATVDRVEHRLAELCHLDDALGGSQLHQLAVAEFRWLTQLVETAGYDTLTGQRLFGLLTEAARLCGWLHFDTSDHAAAQSYYIAGLRCSASANDPLAGAHVLACMSLQASQTGHHQDGVTLIDSAHEQLATLAA